MLEGEMLVVVIDIKSKEPATRVEEVDSADLVDKALKNHNQSYEQ